MFLSVCQIQGARAPKYALWLLKQNFVAAINRLIGIIMLLINHNSKCAGRWWLVHPRHWPLRIRPSHRQLCDRHGDTNSNHGTDELWKSSETISAGDSSLTASGWVWRTDPSILHSCLACLPCAKKCWKYRRCAMSKSFVNFKSTKGKLRLWLCCIVEFCLLCGSSIVVFCRVWLRVVSVIHAYLISKPT